MRQLRLAASPWNSHAELPNGKVAVPKPGAPAPAAALNPETAAVQQYVQQSDEVDSLMHSFSRMLATIEQQAADVNEYARRLDTAYKELESTSAQLKEFSFKDEVTGLYNRRFFSIRLEEEVSRYRRFNHPVSVVLLDLDGFKAVNDELGHAAGDETLRAMPDAFVEIGRDLAKAKGIANGERVVVESARGRFEGYALVTDRFEQFWVQGRIIHQVGVPWHWGWLGLSKGDSANVLTPHVGDANTMIPEFKAFLCDVNRKGSV